jgi:ribosomal protein S18 acetylase RimI-like enzyme
MRMIFIHCQFFEASRNQISSINYYEGILHVKRPAPSADNIQQRIRRLKMTRVIEVEGAKVGDTAPAFRYVIMNLPISKISSEKLAEMASKTQQVRPMLKTWVASEADIPRLVDLYNASFFQCPDPYRPVTESDMRAIFEKSTVIMGSMYGMDAAFIVNKIETHASETGKNERLGVICGIAVHPRFRQKGLATAIGLDAYDFFKDKNVDYLQCVVYEKNDPSMSFITWVGFRPAGQLVVKAPSAQQINPLEHV